MFKRIFFFILFFAILALIILFARGYRFNIEKKEIVPSGIAIISSYPTGAKIFVNGELRGATNTNIVLESGKYKVEIKKEGYTTWEDEITVKGEIVTKVDALLFPLNPSLIPITSVGVKKAFWSQAGDKVMIYGKIDTLEGNGGIYVLDTSKRPLSIFNPIKLLVSNTVLPVDFNVDNLLVEFSPDSKDALVEIKGLVAYLIPTDIETVNPIDVSKSVEVIKGRWKELTEEKTHRMIEVLKEPIQKIASESFKIISFSPDETKFIYYSDKDTELPLVINPPSIGSNTAEEVRKLNKNTIYLYDIKEDKNFAVKLNGDSITNKDLDSIRLLWYIDSQHLVVQKNKQVILMNYDSKNRQTIYSGPFQEDFIAISGDGRILILTNLNPDSNPSPDIYAIGIR